MGAPRAVTRLNDMQIQSVNDPESCYCNYLPVTLILTPHHVGLSLDFLTFKNWLWEQWKMQKAANYLHFAGFRKQNSGPRLWFVSSIYNTEGEMRIRIRRIKICPLVTDRRRLKWAAQWSVCFSTIFNPHERNYKGRDRRSKSIDCCSVSLSSLHDQIYFLKGAGESF